jgi:hypothetical protein
MMTQFKNWFLPLAGAVLVFAAVFHAHQSMHDHPGVEPVVPSRTAIQPPAAEIADAPSIEADLLKQVFDALEKNDRVSAALAVYQWIDRTSEVKETMLELVKNEGKMLTDSSWDDAPEEFYYPAIFRLAESDPDFVEENLEVMDGRMALVAALLRKYPDAALASADGELLDFCRKFVAARHAEFDLSRANALGVSRIWFVRIWLQRGMSATDLLRDESAIDSEIVSAIFLHEMENRDASRIAKILTSIKDPLLIEAAKAGMVDALKASLMSPLDSLKLIDLFDLDFASQGGSTLYHYYHYAISDDPVATADWINRLDPEKRKKALSNIFSNSTYGEYNTAGWLELYKRLPREDIPSFERVSLYLTGQIQSDPRSTLEWFEHIVANDHFSTGENSAVNAGAVRRHAIELGRRLAVEGLDSAIERARRILSDELRDAVLGGVLESALTSDIEKARELLDEIGEPARSAREIDIFRSEFAGLPVESALSKVREILAPKRRDEVSKSILEDQEIPIASRIALIEENPKYFANAWSTVARQWARESPDAAAAWIAQHAELDDYVSEITELWAERDVNAAAAWLRDLPPGHGRDQAAGKIIDRSLELDPHTALEWAASIGDPGSRLQNLKKAVIAIDTNSTVPDEAITGLEKIELTADERTQLVDWLDAP